MSFVIPAHEGQTLTTPPSLADPDVEPAPTEPATPEPPVPAAETEQGATVVPFHQRTSTASSS
jgi:hypothetical protein